MLTVMNLLAQPVFSEFRLVTDRSGLYNQVNDSGIFEWENEEAIKSSFHMGDFIITTMSSLKDDPEAAEKAMKLLLNRHISALCIKDVHFKEVPAGIIELANKLHIPIFMFSDVYFDDIIFAVKSSLSPAEANRTLVEKMRKILYDNTMDDMAIEIAAKEINPYFFDNAAAFFVMPRSQGESGRLLADYATELEKNISGLRAHENTCYSVLHFPRGISVLYTKSSSGFDAVEEATSLFREMNLDNEVFSIGISRKSKSLTELGLLFKESVYAAVDAVFNEKDYVCFANMGLGQMLIPLRNNYWVESFYRGRYQKIADYDEAHNSNLLETLMTYIRMGEDINKTAEATFQHGNTVRYRIEKILKIMEIEDAPDWRYQLYAFACLHSIKEIFFGSRL